MPRSPATVALAAFAALAGLAGLGCLALSGLAFATSEQLAATDEEWLRGLVPTGFAALAVAGVFGFWADWRWRQPA
ncbi:MAG: hypothetical protein QOD77_2044 [Thermoplasmata archaeon]|jgi:ABC-type proline/glycine betaine transport system permease subunit|nr:hypothetical protein [Thermoplasmata archaeon]